MERIVRIVSVLLIVGILCSLTALIWMALKLANGQSFTYTGAKLVGLMKGGAL